MRDFQQDLDSRKQQYLYRSRRTTSSPQAPVMQIDGREVISFCSNDYLGLANHPKVIKAFQQASNEFGVGAGAAHLINGHSRYHHQLEVALAAFVGTERALLFSTGYMANLGVVQALMKRGDRIFADRLNHASLIDGARLSDARLHRYPHQNIAGLEKLLKSKPADQRLIMTDGVFSMDGDIAQLSELMRLANTHDTWLLVDDAHGLGVLGANGRGSLEALDVPNQKNLILMGTLGKAFGVAGAFVAGSESLIETLIQTARTYIFTTAMPAATAAAAMTSLKIIQSEPQRRARLHDRVKYFKDHAAATGIALM
ncbi:MAG TPA: 8-amino-7-oxononanoate synthase, partial [Gammaproteobacteria bacterium]|nr:8-amino-7-oxononanoate synthase [Gammaproteobacteria bacterium]